MALTSCVGSIQSRVFSGRLLRSCRPRRPWIGGFSQALPPDYPLLAGFWAAGCLENVTDLSLLYGGLHERPGVWSRRLTAAAARGIRRVPVQVEHLVGQEDTAAGTRVTRGLPE